MDEVNDMLNYITSSVEVKNAYSYTSVPQYAFMAQCVNK